MPCWRLYVHGALSQTPLGALRGLRVTPLGGVKNNCSLSFRWNQNPSGTLHQEQMPLKMFMEIYGTRFELMELVIKTGWKTATF